MRKVINILSIVTLLSAAVSCVKSDRIYDNSRSEIDMDPVMSVMSKAIVSGTGYPVDVPFGVFATYSSNPAGEWTSGSVQSYLENKKFIHKGDNKYGGEQPAYWPLSGSLVFAGYSPYYPDSQDNDAVSAAYDSATKTLSISNFVSNGQTDLMYFLPTLSNSDNYVGTLDKSNSVSAQFLHALSLISFEIKADPLDDGRVTLKTVTLKNANTKGDFSATCVSSSSAGTLSWKNQIKTSECAVASSSLPTVLSSSSALATQDLFVPGSNLTNSPVVEFKYEIAYNTVDGSGNVVNATKEETTSFTIKDYTAEWEAGKKYVYAVTIGLNRIEFENLTAEWR